MSEARQQPRRRAASLRKILGFSLLGFMVLVIIASVVAAIEDDSNDEALSSTPTLTVADVEATAAAQLAADPGGFFEDFVERTLGRSNRGVDRINSTELHVQSDGDVILLIDWAINANLNDELTRQNARGDTRRILMAIAESGLEYDRVSLVGSHSIVDVFGVATETEVVRANYSREDLDRINWELFQTDNVFVVADFVELHPLFRE